MSLLHLKAQQIIVSKKAVMTPEFLTIESRRLDFVDANPEDVLYRRQTSIRT